jgi:hypothetical protein
VGALFPTMTLQKDALNVGMNGIILLDSNNFNVVASKDYRLKI